MRSDPAGDYSLRQETVRVLLKHGANIDAVTTYGYTVLHGAYCGSMFDVAAQLERAGADTTVLTPKGKLARELIDKQKHDAYLKHCATLRWGRRKHFAYFLREFGLARGLPESVWGVGLLGHACRAALLQVLAADALQSAIAS
jgi:ankyrin repeat protein